MDTPKRFGGRWLAFALSCVALCFAAEGDAASQPLTVEAQVDGTWVRVLRTEREHVVGGDPTNPCEIPASAPLRLVGELLDNTESLDSALAFELTELPSPSDSDKSTRWVARNLHFRTDRIDASGPSWQSVHPERAVLVCLWQIDGKTTEMRAMPMSEYPAGHFGSLATQLKIELSETPGNAVFLLLEDGVAQPRLPPSGNAVAERLGVLAALGQDRAVAETLRGTESAKVLSKDASALLRRCAQAGSIQSVDALLTLGADPKAESEAGDTALHLAARCGRTAVAARLLAAQSPVAAVNKRKYTPLHAAASGAHAEICQLLAQAGAPLNALNAAGETPAHLAVLAGCTAAVESLREHKAQFDFNPETAARALVFTASQGRRQLLRLLLAQPLNPNKLIWRDQTALIAAAREGHEGAVKDLLAAKADPNCANGTGLTPLLAAATRGRASVIQCLLAAGARPNAAVKSGFTPLHAACSAGSAPSVRALIAAGAPVNRTTGGLPLPLTFAVNSGAREAVQEMIAAGAKVDPARASFDTDLSDALAIDADTFLAAALKAGTAIDYRPHQGWSMLHISILAKAERCTALLRAAGAKEPGTAHSVSALKQLEKRPELLDSPRPFDPRDPDESDLKAEKVMVDAVIDEEGFAVFAHALCHDSRLSQSAARAVLAVHFSPALADGEPVAIQVRVPVQFPDRTDSAVDFNFLDIQPQAISRIPPRYPFDMKSIGATGSAIVRFIVAPDGTTQDIEVVAATRASFGTASVEAIKQWRFKPGMRDGKAVATRLEQTFPFSMSR